MISLSSRTVFFFNNMIFKIVIIIIYGDLISSPPYFLVNVNKIKIDITAMNNNYNNR